MQPVRTGSRRPNPVGRSSRTAGLGRALCLAAVLTVVGAAPAGAHDHDPEEAGHPLRIVAYALHPVGVALDWLIMRPAHWVGHHEPFRTLFGHDEGW